MKRRLSLLLCAALLVAGAFISVRSVRADYIGPNRPRPAVRDTSGDYVVMQKVSGPGSVSICQINTGAAGGDCNTYSSLEQQEYWCNSGVLHPPGWCAAHPGACWTGQIIDRYCHYTGGGSYPPAVVSAAPSCSLAGSNGWCRAGAGLDITASEPLSGQVITLIESDAFGVLCDPPDAASLSCWWAAPEGSTSLQLWALSSYGDSSLAVSASIAQDSQPPLISPIPAPTGSSGWFAASEPLLACSASDAVSGVASALIRLDGGEYLASVTVPEGVHNLECAAVDLAGNSATSSPQEVRVDITPPEVEINVTPPIGEVWTNVPPVVSALGSDVLSGMESLCLRTSTAQSACGVESQALAVEGQGEIQVFVDALDRAGNASPQRFVSLFVDTGLPEIVLTAPESTPHLSSGLVTFAGTAADSLSGLSEVHLSSDGGETWTGITASDGTWSYDWDTLSVPDGEHTLLFRALDAAGNFSSEVRAVVVVNNLPPLVELTPAWSLGQSGTLAVSANPTSAIQSVQARVLDSAGSLVYLFAELPQPTAALQWDGTRLDGGRASPGSYTVEVTALDLAGRSSVAYAQIIIPFPPTATPRSFFSFIPTTSATPSPTQTRTPTHTPTPVPTHAAVLENTTTRQPTRFVQAVSEGEKDTPSPRDPGYGWLGMGFLAALVMLAPAVSGALDPRPTEVLRWAARLEKRI